MVSIGNALVRGAHLDCQQIKDSFLGALRVGRFALCDAVSSSLGQQRTVPEDFQDYTQWFLHWLPFHGARGADPTNPALVEELGNGQLAAEDSFDFPISEYTYLLVAYDLGGTDDPFMGI